MEFRCSGLARVMACPGSGFFTDLPPQEESEAARQGTAFGDYCERILSNKAALKVNDVASNGYVIEGDMAFFAEPLIKDIRERAMSDVICEARIDWQTRAGIWIRGQFDASYVDSSGALCIDDFKYGWGLVEVETNWQLIGYAIGEILRRQCNFPAIKLRILQPRPHHENGPMREWVLTMARLNDYKEMIEMQMSKIFDGDHPLVANPKCRYCPAASVCPAQGKTFYRSVETSQEFVQDNISNIELSDQIHLAEIAMEHIKIRHDSLKSLAINRIKDGNIIPGYAMMENYGDRQWKAGIDPDVIAALSGGVDVTEKTILSPAKAEKLGVSKKVISQLVERKFLGQKLKAVDSAKLGEQIFGGVK